MLEPISAIFNKVENFLLKHWSYTLPKMPHTSNIKYKNTFQLKTAVWKILSEIHKTSSKT